MSFIFTDSNFDQEIKTWVTLVDFWAPWCGPCQMLWPVIEQIAKEYENKAKIWKINVDEHQLMAEKYQVMWIPAIKIFKNWQLVDEITWFVPADTIKQALNKHILNISPANDDIEIIGKKAA